MSRYLSYLGDRVDHLENAVAWLNEAERLRLEMLNAIKNAGGLFGSVACHVREGLGDLIVDAVDKTEEELRGAWRDYNREKEKEREVYRHG